MKRGTRGCGWQGWLCAAGAGLWLGGAWVAPGAVPEDEAFYVPPVEASVTVGGEVRIEVRVLVRERPGLLGSRERELEFGVAVAPRSGTVTRVQQLPRAGDRDGAILTYRHGGGTVAEDDFRVAVREAGRDLLASGQVSIRIMRPSLRAEPEGRLDLGRCAAGDHIEGSVRLENTGSAPLTLQVAVWRPFFVEAADKTLYLGPGVRQSVRVVFRPEVAGMQRTPLILKPELLGDYSIEAGAVDAIVLNTNRVDFGAVRGGHPVSADVRVENRALTPRVASAQVSGPFSAEPGALRLGPGEAGVIRVALEAERAGVAQGWMVVQEGATTLRCQLQGRVLAGPDLVMGTDAMVRVGVVTGLMQSAECHLAVSNRGDMAWNGTVAVAGPFAVRPQALAIDAGATGCVDVAYLPRAAGIHTQEMVFAGQATSTVLVAGECALPARSVLALAGGLPPVTNGSPRAVPAAPPALRPAEVRDDWDALPVFEPPGLRGDMPADTEVVIAWDHTADFPLDRLFLRQRLFVPLDRGRPGFVWQARIERPQLSPDRATARITLKDLRPGWAHVFALVEVDAAGEAVRRSPLIEVTGGLTRMSLPRWVWVTVVLLAVAGALGSAAWWLVRDEQRR